LDARGVKASLKVKASNVGEMMRTFGVVSDLSSPLEASAALRELDDRYLVDDLKLTLGASDLSGELSYEKKKNRPQINAKLVSNLLDLDSFASGKKKQKTDRVFPDEPLPVEALRSVDADVSLKANQVRTAGLEINAVSLDLKLLNGRLTLVPKGGLYGGEVGGSIGLDAAADRPRLETVVEAKHVNLAAMVNAMQKSELLAGGPTDLSLKLKGAGKSPHDIAASSDGMLLAVIGPGRIHTSAVEKVGADAVMQALRAASGEGQADYTGFDCGVARFVIKKGEAVADKGIAVQNARMNVVGSGTVDLDTEKVDIAIKTEPREGVGLSVSAVGLGVRVGGTLANPTTSVDPLGTAKAGASAAAAVATGGLSLLGQALFSRATADEAPCDTARGIKPKKTASTSTSSKQTQESGGSGSGGASGAADAVTDTLKGVGDKLKGLFGN
ncbi:MAG: AsmA family protein, partial [Gammaproteobacteria bacterium]|nr:AsmA family protein [Gammaproteobacteria bacterium]